MLFMEKNLSKFPNKQKKFSMLFLFNFVPQQILNFLCEKLFVKLIASRFRQKVYFSRFWLCFIYFDVIIRQRLKKKFKLVELFFSCGNEIKTCGLVQQLILGMFRDLILQSRDQIFLSEYSGNTNLTSYEFINSIVLIV